MKQVFEIVKYELIGGKTLYTKKLLPDVQAIEERGKQKFIDASGKDYGTSHLWHLTTEPNKAAYPADTKFLPYTATVTEDLPSWCQFAPKVYENCKLMTEKHGGYLQFYHKKTKKVLRIAMNSHYYQPTGS